MLSLYLFLYLFNEMGEALSVRPSLDYIAGIDLALGHGYPALTKDTDKLFEAGGHTLRWIAGTVGYVVMQVREQ
jgi:hypothetical protein